MKFLQVISIFLLSTALVFSACDDKKEEKADEPVAGEMMPECGEAAEDMDMEMPDEEGGEMMPDAGMEEEMPEAGEQMPEEPEEGEETVDCEECPEDEDCDC